MKSPLARTLPTLLLIFASVAAAADRPQYYSIKMGEKLFGYAQFSSETLKRDGKQFTQLNSQTSLKVALLGKPRTTVLASTTLVEPDTGHPVEYRLTNTTNDVVTHVDSNFDNLSARTWSYREGDERGDPMETKLPNNETMILGNNNFAHWQLLLERAAGTAKEGKATISVFVPESHQVAPFVLVRRETKELAVAGQTRQAEIWYAENAQLELAVDAESHQFLRMHVPQQQMTVELASEDLAKLFDKAQAEELLADQFIQSNVTFDDFLKVTKLEAKVDVEVIGSGVENDVEVLTTQMQQFNGEKKESKISGQVVIKTVRYDARQSPPYPGPEAAAQLADYLQPGTCIESDHGPIRKLSAELVGDATSRWDVVKRIAGWVHKEIAYTIADSPSARLALETKKGDCGPHSTLTIALLRAAGIPARLVGGAVYTPSFGGSFGQHAWVEVHMGPAGWIAIDPTTGELEQMSATHIKFFEGLGGVRPQTIEVTGYEPANRVEFYTPPAEPKPLAWELGHPYTFRYIQGNKTLGDENFTISKTTHNGAAALKIKSDVKLKLNLLASLTSDTELVAAPSGRPFTFARQFSLPLNKTRVECSFTDQSAQVDVSGAQTLSREVKLPPGVFCFDNNLMGSWAVICSQLELVPDTPITIRTFHPSSLQIISLTITPKEPAVITVAGEEVECFECDAQPLKNTFWIARDGRLLRTSQGTMVIELVK